MRDEFLTFGFVVFRIEDEMKRTQSKLQDSGIV